MGEFGFIQTSRREEMTSGGYEELKQFSRVVAPTSPESSPCFTDKITGVSDKHQASQAKAILVAVPTAPDRCIQLDWAFAIIIMGEGSDREFQNLVESFAPSVFSL